MWQGTGVFRLCCSISNKFIMSSVLNNEAKNRPIDRPRVATSLPSATGWAALDQEGAIISDRANIDLPDKYSPAEP